MRAARHAEARLVPAVWRGPVTSRSFAQSSGVPNSIPIVSHPASKLVRAARWCVAAAALSLPAAALAQPSGAAPASASPVGASPYHGRLGQTSVALPRVATGVRVDGVLDESAWSGAALLTGFSQFSPVDGVAAADSTEVFVMYGDHAIYFGVRAFEPHGVVNATLADRDRIGGDDYIQLILDTFNDRRRAVIFAVNPFGVQSDGTYLDGTGADLNPDFQFESKGRLTDYGYEVEIRIPFKSLRYQSGKVQDWGVNIIRRVQHSGQEHTWTAADRGAQSFLAQSGVLRDLTDLRRGLVLDLNPVMTARTTGAPRSADGSTVGWRYAREAPEFGANVVWGVTPDVTVNATVRPDFSQVEADVGQVVYDPRAAISYPEKRPFFLEGSEHFQVPNALIYTRRIASPDGALKLTGKLGGTNVGVLSAVDGDATVLGRERNPIYNLLRARRDLGASSNIGMVYTDRVHGPASNRVGGVDTRLLFGGRYVFNGQLAASQTRGVPGADEAVRPLFDFTLTQTGRTSGFNLVVEGIHPGFVAASGFIPRPGIAHANFTPRRTFYPQNSRIESIVFTPILDGTWVWDRFTRGTEPDDIKVNTSTTFVLRGGWRTNIYTWTETFKYPSQLFANAYTERRGADGTVRDTVPFRGTDRLTNIGGFWSLNTPQWRTFSLSTQFVGGQDVNYDEWSSAWILFSTITADWRPTERIRVNARYLEQRYHRKSDGSEVRVRAIPRVRLEYQLARPIFFRFVGQHDGTRIDALRDDSRTEGAMLFRRADGTFRRSERQVRSGFRADWLFSYQPNPGTVFFAGYGASMGSDEFFEPRDLRRTNDGFFVKASYLFRN